MKTLIIVESPTKANTIKNLIPKDYEVVASVGHIRDLATSGKGGYGVNIEKDFKPNYIIIPTKYKTVKQIQKQAQNKKVLIATDPDREGEAIAWHIATLLNLDVNEKIRIRFFEVTKNAINKALANPKPIDMNLVSSQETRRILDRIIGFDLSKLVQRKLHSTSAGRVQSVALKMIYERENEILNFVKEAYYLVFAEFAEFKADYEKNSPKQKDKSLAERVCKEAGKDFEVTNIQIKNQNLHPAYPYTTSRLQQDGIVRLKMNASTVMRTAQKLYEGVKIDNQLVGLITYMRTDSTRLSQEFVRAATAYIKTNYGSEYFGRYRVPKATKSSQEAHEAIRPTDLNYTPEKVKPFLNNREFLLYQMIYNRAVGSLMKPGIDELKTVTLSSGGHNFLATFTKQIFLGYRILYVNDTKDEAVTFNYSVGDKLASKRVYQEKKFTQPRRRYSEATLIQEMEKLGIGRPSTYAETTRKIADVGYVRRQKGYFVPTEQGMLTAANLVEYFTTFINTSYTSKMEEQLDLIADGKEMKTEILNSFITTFKPLLENANKKMPYQAIKKEVVEVGEMCPRCGKPLVYRENKKGEKFIACSGFSSKPQCTYTRSIEE
ncbi:MAG: type I DNA topoisomerase [Acholeplasmataceae bacterium]|jgi:DNA topoisomerase-1|nr:type I DNA topoisomerase [Acholeplasmataceae bacterium]